MFKYVCNMYCLANEVYGASWLSKHKQPISVIYFNTKTSFCSLPKPKTEKEITKSR